MMGVLIFCVGLVCGVMIGAGIVGFYDSIEDKPKEEDDGEKKV